MNQIKPVRASTTWRLLTPTDAADMLGFDVRTIQRYAAARRLPHVKIGRYIRFREEALIAWAEANEVSA
jgi:excisionase family DNA binding protein